MIKIIKFFNVYFPSLKKITKNGIYQKLGSLIIGIEFENSSSSKEYSIYFVMSGLWGNIISDTRIVSNELNSCLNSPDIHIRLVNKKGLPIKLNQDNLEITINDVVDSLNKLIEFQMDVSLQTILSLIKHYEFDVNVIGGSSGALANLLKFKYFLSVSIEDVELQNSILHEIEKRSKEWNMNHFELWHGNFENWFNNLKKTTKEDIDKSTNLIINNSEVKNLNSYEIK